jgi:hypothetical protein
MPNFSCRIRITASFNGAQKLALRLLQLDCEAASVSLELISDYRTKEKPRR